ncbi:adenylate/guanylate cyclase domain-containing protein [Nannocystis bainbridge]|uniref:Adenylate/guanylate cyclase domain-containing protein n=1 Tax=Nannocystis bainbridge TaxID=2995303 RepID=A0ABT5E0I2_9BACT|nr:adenylate/guanylate cyclase domain-containing protein [Nannocystis bainbridge]MDC0719382.1 adenylate/guanylate cyclase domain-containing protein [Nannocystis bainbridge]
MLTDDARWRRALADPEAAAELLADPAARAAFVAAAAALQAEHDDLVLLHDSTLEHANEIEEQLAVKIEQVEALVVELELRNTFIRQMFGRHVTDEVVNTLLASPEGRQLGGERRTLTILISDLRGFSTLCEGLGPEQVVAILNIYLGAMADVIGEYRGSINEFIGDAILAVFGAPVPQDDHPERAVACAIAMQRAMGEVNAALAAHGLPALEMGIGVHTGEVVVGNIGSNRRAKYGVVGRHVNLTSRIESYTVGGQVLISESAARALGDRLRTRGCFEVRPKGVREPITIHDVTGVDGPFAIHMAEETAEWRILAQPQPLVFTALEGKDTGGQEVPALLVAHDERHNAELQVSAPLPLRADLKLVLAALPGVDAYAKVVAASPGRAVVRFTALPRALTELLDALPARA